MKNRILIYSLALVTAVVMLTPSCKKKTQNNNTDPTPVTPTPTTPTATTVTDVDGNVYHTVTIGTQVWMVENLKTTKYRNGDVIPNVTDSALWRNLSTGAYCNYNNNVNNVTTYGRLYNWYTIADSRNVCPTGWHVPTDAEWTTLVNYVGGASVAGGKLKETGTAHWQSPNNGATNEKGFTALPGGNRTYNATFGYIGLYGYWWSSTEYNPYNAWYSYMGYGVTDVSRNYSNKGVVGFSIRCIKD
jgi:uncharacterized protein (TIGR02145 family)